MIRDQLQTLLRRRPFQPFRVHLTDGRIFDVRFPRMNLLAETYVKIGIPISEEEDIICDHTEYVPFKLIERIEDPASSQSSAAS